MFTTLKNAIKVKEIRYKLLLTLGFILLFRLGSWIPVPGINSSVFESEASGGFLSLLSGLSGGALSNGAFLALGVSPYISASIIMQLLTVAIPALERLSKMGEDGKKKITKYTKYVALILATAQAVGIVLTFGVGSGESAIQAGLFGAGSPAWMAAGFVILCLVAGAMFTYWLGEKITEIGIGQGLSLLIFVGILSTASNALMAQFSSVFSNNLDALWDIIIFAIALISIFGLIVFVDLSERKIPVQYAKQIKGRKMYGGQTTFIPIRVNGSGVLPIIFSMSLLAFPQLLMSIFWPTSSFYGWYGKYLGTGTILYSVLVGLLILFFAYFYSQISFNPADVSKNIQQNGGFIPGIRAGKPTAEYLNKISKRITLFGAIFLAFIAIVPTILFTQLGSGILVGAFSATGMLIVVSVALEFNKQLEAQMLMKNYKGFLK